MRIFRERSPNYPASPICNLYGRKDNFLIGPYELVLFDERKKVIASASDAGLIKDSVNKTIGKISGSELPGTVVGNLIKPIVRISPNDGDINFAPDVARSSPPAVVISSPVILDVLSGAGTITGTVINAAQERPFAQIGGVSAIGYIVGFNTQLATKYIGARVLLNDPDNDFPLLGMLYDIFNGSRGRVFPCELL